MKGERQKYINYERKYIADINAHSRKLHVIMTYFPSYLQINLNVIHKYYCFDHHLHPDYTLYWLMSHFSFIQRIRFLSTHN